VERVAESPKLEASLLDSVILNGDGVYAELTGPGGAAQRLDPRRFDFSG
jgi:hypothetical protein